MCQLRILDHDFSTLFFLCIFFKFYNTTIQFNNKLIQIKKLMLISVNAISFLEIAWWTSIALAEWLLKFTFFHILQKRLWYVFFFTFWIIRALRILRTIHTHLLLYQVFVIVVRVLINFGACPFLHPYLIHIGLLYMFNFLLRCTR